jgi:hypothetical protein
MIANQSPKQIEDPSPTLVAITSNPANRDYLLVWHEDEIVAVLEPGDKCELPFSPLLAVASVDGPLTYDVRYFR